MASTSTHHVSDCSHPLLLTTTYPLELLTVCSDLAGLAPATVDLLSHGPIQTQRHPTWRVKCHWYADHAPCCPTLDARLNGDRAIGVGRKGRIRSFDVLHYVCGKSLAMARAAPWR